MHVLVSSDGFVGEDGRAGWAFVARDAGAPADALVARAGRMPASASSHLTEWTAVFWALAWIEETLTAGDTFELRTDSALVAKGLASRRPEMSGEAAALRASSRQSLARLAGNSIRGRVVRVRREENEEADALARAAALE